ncbi:type VI secretion system lipoprotein TssJ [Donghicola mangrovi]|uniref:Type VI secretion system lipoprotein TssJ n=1 Tax=Donghicola mangrovi TaxID=2729614 RepID=A0A850Q0F3_9RHOB|nr:type VI secretion system lipoprotein TssJ [Donghicola mangrovi]NVO23017.1 type VI secretion system lipoprotein TssJ [Donghicola mangrovi]
MTLQQTKRVLPFLALAIWGLTGCAPKPEDPMPVNKTLVVTAGSNVNQYSDVAHPVVIRLYQLSSRTEFEAANFWDIFNNSETLAGVVIDRRSLSPLYPDEKRLVALDLEKDAFYLGAFAEFADYEQQAFADVVPISAGILDAGVTVTVTSGGVAIKYRQEDMDPDNPKPKKKGLFAAVKGIFAGGSK